MYIVIAGAGRLGLILAKGLKNQKHQVCLIDRDQRLCDSLARELTDIMIIRGDATQPDVLKDAQIEKANVSVATTSTDEDNIIFSYFAKELFGVKRTISRVNNSKHIPLYKHMKVDNPVDSTSIIARIIEEEASFSDVMNLLSIKKGRLSVVRVDIPEDSPVANKSLKDIKLPANSVLISVLRGPEIIIPSGSTTILSGDEVIATTLIDREEDLTKALIGRV